MWVKTILNTIEKQMKVLEWWFKINCEWNSLLTVNDYCLTGNMACWLSGYVDYQLRRIHSCFTGVAIDCLSNKSANNVIWCGINCFVSQRWIFNTNNDILFKEYVCGCETGFKKILLLWISYITVGRLCRYSGCNHCPKK